MMKKKFITLRFSIPLSLIILLAVFVFSPARTTFAATIEDLLAQIKLLQTQIAYFQSISNFAVSQYRYKCNVFFVNDLRLYDDNRDVIQLQKVLNSSLDTQVSTTGYGSPGNETTFFGPLTYGAVVKFQEKYAIEILSPVGLREGTGFVGVGTRSKLNSICNAWNQISAGQSGNVAGVANVNGGSSSVGPFGSAGSNLSTNLPSGGSSSSSGGPPLIGEGEQFPAAPPAPIPPSTPPSPSNSNYPLHKNITAAVFWVGEPQGGGSSENNALSAWDDEWQRSYGGYDDYQNRNGYYPAGFIPKENPFYLDLPYNDFNDNGTRKANSYQVVPWANEKTWGNRESMMKNRWVKLIRNNITCYGQIEDAGPYQYDDHVYVFGSANAKPKNTLANNAGLDVSPALRDCLQFVGLNNVSNKVDWQFVDFADVPDGPWKEIITTSQINWP